LPAAFTATSAATGDVYQSYGEDEAAISTLLAGSLMAETADVIGRLSPARRNGVGAAGIRSFVTELPDGVLEAHPEVWLQSARASDADGHWADRAHALQRAESAARAGSDQPDMRHYGEALAAIEEARQLMGGNARGRAMALTWRSDTLLEVARVEEAEAGITEKDAPRECGFAGAQGLRLLPGAGLASIACPDAVRPSVPCLY
jgi:hypothetical protein